MKKIILIGLCIASLGSFSLGESAGDFRDDNTVVNYLGRFAFNNMHCSFIINGLLLTASPLKLGRGWEPNHISWSDHIGSLLIEGENLIEMEGIQIPREPQDGSDSYCQMTITAMAENRETGESGSKEVFNLKLSFDAEGKFTVADSKQYPAPSVTDEPTFKVLDRKVSKVDWVNNNILAQRHLQINHPHTIYAWTQTQPFKNTPQNIARLWAAYAEIEQAFIKQDEKKLEQIFAIASEGGDRYTGYTGEGSRRWNAWLNVFRERWESNNGHHPVPINKEDYVLDIANHGKLFRLIRKGSFISSPLVYQNKPDNRVYNFYFTEIDGKIVPAIL